MPLAEAIAVAVSAATDTILPLPHLSDVCCKTVGIVVVVIVAVLYAR